MSASYPYALGLIGAGAMGTALLRAFLQRAVLTAKQVLVWEIDPSRRRAVCEQLQVGAADSAQDLARRCETILIAVKPQSLPGLVSSLPGAVQRDQLVISILAGVTLQRLREACGEGVPLVRVMPNILCTVQEGASAYAASAEVSERQRAWVEALLGSAGLVLPVEERLLDAVTGLSGSGPAFAAVFCEALADGGVAAGLPRAVALQLAAQVLVGTGRWILEHGGPAQLKDAVTSPAGTTIAGLQALEAGGLRSAALQAVRAAAERSSELGRDSG